MKYAFLILIVLGLLFTACNTELSHEDHDHDGDGTQDHSPEEHDEHENEEGLEEANLMISSNIYKQ